MAISKIASIIAKKRLADIAKKKVVKVPNKEAREIARESNKRIGGMAALRSSSRTIPTRPTKVPKDLSTKKVTPPPGKRSIYQERIKQGVREGTGVPARKGKKYTGPINPPGPRNRPAGLKEFSEIERREPRPAPLSKLEVSILRKTGKRDYSAGGVNPLAFKIQQQEADNRVVKALREIKKAEKTAKQVNKNKRRSR